MQIHRMVPNMNETFLKLTSLSNQKSEKYKTMKRIRQTKKYHPKIMKLLFINFL